MGCLLWEFGRKLSVLQQHMYRCHQAWMSCTQWHAFSITSHSWFHNKCITHKLDILNIIYTQQPTLPNISQATVSIIYSFNTLRPRQNGRHFADDTFQRIFMNKNVKISINISLKFVPQGPINNIPALFLIMAWRRPGDKPSSEPVMFSLLTHIWVTRLNELITAKNFL